MPPSAPKAKPNTLIVELGLGLGVLIGLGIFWYFYNAPIATQIEAANQEHARLKQEEVTVNQAFAAYQKDFQLLQDKREKAKDWNRVLPPTAEMGPFLLQINEQANAAGLKVKSVVPGEEKPQEFFARVPVSLEVYGRFHQVARFLSSVAHMERIINVENIEIGNPVVNSEDQTVLTVKCLTTTFHAVVPSASPSASASGGPKK